MSPDYGPPDDWDTNEAPREPSYAERAEKQRTARVDANEEFDPLTAQYVFMLAHAVAKLGGVLVIHEADRRLNYSLATDYTQLESDGIIRLFAHLQENE